MIARALRFIETPDARRDISLSGFPQQGGRGHTSRFLDATSSFFSSPLVGEAGRGAAGADFRDRKPAAKASQQKATS